LTFIVLDVVSGPEPQGYPSKRPAASGLPGMFDITQPYDVTISVNVYANNAHLATTSKIAMMIRSEPYTSRMAAKGFGCIDKGVILDNSDFDETRFNLRAHIDLIFTYISLESDINIGEINHVRANGTLGDIDVPIDVHKNRGIL